MSHKEVPTNSTAYACHTPIQVRFRDLDAMAHVNNAVYFTYFEIGRETYMEAMGYAKEGTDDIHDRFPFILAEISCRYLRPVQPGETVTIHIRVNRLGNSSWGFQYLLTSDAHNEAVAAGARWHQALRGPRHDVALHSCTPEHSTQDSPRQLGVVRRARRVPPLGGPRQAARARASHKNIIATSWRGVKCSS